MSTSEFDKYKVDHLFLLIGENLLPNYVAANLLVNKGKSLYLIHTTDTERQAKRLQGILLSDEINGLKAVELRSLNDYESDAYYIQKEIRAKLESIKSGKIGLNYTGGTKAMSAHAYRTLFYEETKDKTYRQRADIIFSYLDPRRLEMCIDREDNERVRIKVKPEVLKVEIKRVFELHGWRWGSEPTEEPEQAIATQAFADFHTQEDSLSKWKSWCYEVLRPVTKDKRDNWLEEKELKKVLPLSLETIKSEPKINNALIELGLTGEELSLQTLKEQGFKNIKQVCKWLDGEWLEHYVLYKIKEISEKYLIHDSATSFWISTSDNPKQNKFQFDVAFMRGYQLFAISCTTDATKKLCKSKLFEAYIRAQQLGGTEARVALVCCSNTKDIVALRSEITNVFSPEPDAKSKDKKIAVFGREHLINLSEEIINWIVENDREAK